MYVYYNMSSCISLKDPSHLYMKGITNSNLSLVKETLERGKRDPLERKFPEQIPRIPCITG